MNFLILKQFFIFFKDVKFHAAAVAFGGALGALARCGVSLSVDNQILAVFICNICGSFILATAIELRTKIRSELESLVSIGFCGGLSIFASFSRDSVAALRAENFFPIFYKSFGEFYIVRMRGFSGAIPGGEIALYFGIFERFGRKPKIRFGNRQNI